VLGGSPADYLKLEEAIIDNKWSLSDTASDKVVNQVKDHLHSVLTKSLNSILKSSSTTKKIIEIFREEKTIMIPMPQLAAEGLLLDYPNKVFREVVTMEDSYIVPSSPAVSLIITENIQNGVGVRELRDKLFKAT
jgi:hypothetical protein